MDVDDDDPDKPTTGPVYANNETRSLTASLSAVSFSIANLLRKLGDSVIPHTPRQESGTSLVFVRALIDIPIP